MEKIIHKNLIDIAEAYRKATERSLADIGREFYGRADFFPRLKAGKRSISVRQAGRMLEKFRQKWPANADWPLVRTLFMTRERI